MNPQSQTSHPSGSVQNNLPRGRAQLKAFDGMGDREEYEIGGREVAWNQIDTNLLPSSWEFS